MRKIKQGDEVMVIAGKDKGRRGVVTRMVLAGKKVIVEGINLVHKHVKPNPNKGVEGGIVKREAAIDTSNVAIYNVNTQRVTKVGFKFLKDGKKVRYYKDDGELVDV